MAAGTVAALWRYPVKSMAGESLSRVWLGEAGIPGDRLWALRSGENVLSAKRAGALMSCSARLIGEAAEIDLPDGRTLSCLDESCGAQMSAFLGFDVGLEAAAGAHFDARPVHLLTTASLKSLSALKPGSAFDVRRFRPNIVVETPEGTPFPELGWTGELRVGEAVLRIDKPTMRCVMTTHPQASLAKDPAVLKTIVEATGGALGVYARVLRPGWIALDDQAFLGYP